MQVRSWMAAVVLMAGSTVLLSGVARSQRAGSDQIPPKAQRQDGSTPKTGDRQDTSVPDKKPAAANSQPVELTLMIAGLGHDGCEVEIRPGNRSSRFKPQRQRVQSEGIAKFVFPDIELRGADRNCSFAIIVNEAGQAPRTIYRGFRIASRPAPGPSVSDVQKFTCYMNSPSRLAGLDRSARTRQ